MPASALFQLMCKACVLAASLAKGEGRCTAMPCSELSKVKATELGWASICRR